MLAVIAHRWKLTYAWSRDLARRPALWQGLQGGILLQAWLQQFLMHWGLSSPVVVGLGLALAVLAVASGVAGPWMANRPLDRRPQAAGAQGLLAVWTVAFPAILGVCWKLVAWGGERLADEPLAIAGVAGTAALAALGLPVLALLGAFNAVTGGDHPRSAWALGLGGAVAGTWLQSFLLAPWCGVQNSALLAACGGLIYLCVTLVQIARGDEMAGTAESAAATNPLQMLGIRERSLVERAGDWLVPLAVGVLLAAASRMLQQLVPQTAYLLAGGCAALLAGLALGLRRSTEGKSSTPVPGWSELAVAVWFAAFLMLFERLVHGLLWLNSWASWTGPLLWFRGLLPVLFVLPAGYWWARRTACCGGESTYSSRRIGLSISLTCLACCAAYALLPLVGPVPLLMAAICSLLATALLPLVGGRTLPPTWRSRGTLAAGVAAVVVGTFVPHSYRPETAARLLFSTSTMLAARAGVPADEMALLDDGRLVVMAEGDCGTYTLWSHNGWQWQLRDSGVPKSITSMDPQIHPHYSAEVLPALLPLVLHERPARTLLLGMGCGTTLETCLAAPIASLTCVERDPVLVRLNRETIRPQSSIWSDDRLRVQTVDPALFVSASRDEFDVVIACLDQSSLAGSAPHYTLEFYQQASRRLAPQGIFCQRFQAIDYGAEPVREQARALQAVFTDVVVLQTAPGELLFAATNDPRGLIRPDLLDRIQARHVSRAMSETGWDWSVLLTLPACRHAQLAEIAGSSGLNTAENGRFPFQLPPEVARWSAKADELYGVLRPHSGRLIDWIGSDGSQPELLRRLSEVSGQQNLMTRYPDQYWAYRKSVREELANRPRSLIKQVNYELAKGGIDEEDRRRMQYFEALGRAVRSLTPVDLANVASYSEPYDPLLSYFTHSEVAELYRRAGHPDPRAELLHRSHAIYFAAGNDRSLHNAHEALRLLVSDPAAEPETVARFNQINALLQGLQIRWASRRSASIGSPRKEMRDADESLVLIEKGLSALDELSAEAGIDPAYARGRREVLERILVRPLRTHRAQLVPYAGREQILENQKGPAAIENHSLLGL